MKNLKIKKYILVCMLFINITILAKEPSLKLNEVVNLKDLLYQEYIENYRKKNELINVEKKYYLSSSLSNDYIYELEDLNLKKNVKFFNEFSKEEIKNKKNYIEVTYRRKKPIKMQVISKNLYKQVTIIFDSHQRILMVDLDYDHKVTIYKYDDNSNSISLNCYKSRKECILGFEELSDKLKSLDADTFSFYDKKYDRFLTKGEYISNIFSELLLEKYQEMFSKLLEEEKEIVSSNLSIKYYADYKLNINNSIQFIQPIDPKIKNKYIKVYYKKKVIFKVHVYEKDELKESIILNERNQLVKVIDFNFYNIKEYKYTKMDNSIDEIECLYLKGTCSVQEIFLALKP